MSNDHLFQNQPQSGNHGNGTTYLGQQYTQYEGQEQEDTEFHSNYFNDAMHFYDRNRPDNDTSDSEFENPENITVDEGHNQDQDEDQGKYENQAQQEGDDNDSNQDDHDGSNPFNYEKLNRTDFGTSDSQAQIPENRTMDVRQEHDQYEDQGQQENKSIPDGLDGIRNHGESDIGDISDNGTSSLQVEKTENRRMDVRREQDQYEDQGQQENKSIPGTFDGTHNDSKRDIEEMSHNGASETEVEGTDNRASDSEVEGTENGTTGAEKKPEGDNESRSKDLSAKQEPIKHTNAFQKLASRADFIIGINSKELEAIRNRQQPHILQYRELPVDTRRVWLYERGPTEGLTHCATISPYNVNDKPKIKTKGDPMKAYKITQLHTLPPVSQLEKADLRSRCWLHSAPRVATQDTKKSYAEARSDMVEFLRPKLVKVFADEEEDPLEHGFTDIVITMTPQHIEFIESQQKTYLLVKAQDKYPAGTKWVWIYEGYFTAALRYRAKIDIPKEPGQLAQEDLSICENELFNNSKTAFNFAYRILGLQSIDCKRAYMAKKNWMKKALPAAETQFENTTLVYGLAPEDMVTTLTPQLKPLW